MNLKAYQVAEIVSGNVVGDDQVLVNSLAKIENGKAGSLSLLGNSKYNKFLKTSKKKANRPYKNKTTSFTCSRRTA